MSLSKEIKGILAMEILEGSKNDSTIHTPKKRPEITSNPEPTGMDSSYIEMHHSENYDWEEHQQQALDNINIDISTDTIKQQAIESTSIINNNSNDEQSENTMTHYKELDIQARKIACNKYGKRKDKSTRLDTLFIMSFSEIIDYDIPSEVNNQLMIDGINQPWKIVNTFGGQMTALAQQLSYAKPSMFLFRHPILTKRLIFFSRLFLNIAVNIKIINPKLWAKKKKSDTYDQDFYNMSDQERSILSVSIADIQLEYQFLHYFNQ